VGKDCVPSDILELYTFLQAFYDTYQRHTWPHTEVGKKMLASNPDAVPTVTQVARAVCDQILAPPSKDKRGKFMYEGEKYMQQKLTVALDLRDVTPWLIAKMDKYEENQLLVRLTTPSPLSYHHN
jgi:hypothetical protein